ncbi:hypothetical protein B0H16DRAFT_315723 [Mycena metata]|uniref:Uncharacterized protein n=1 Tax=Mycena metata TaxID=1033252 RepID=A0AAD7JN39_9AGAR|nr:hypothetical protein B0H16DRAFT_315723 [Mycena metata]
MNSCINQVIGNSVNWLLLGLLLAQLYTYCRRVQRDPSLLRTLVGAIVFFELAHTALLTYHGWWLWLILTESVYGRIKPWDVVNSSNYRARMLVDAACRRSRAIVLRIVSGPTTF